MLGSCSIDRWMHGRRRRVVPWAAALVAAVAAASAMPVWWFATGRNPTPPTSGTVSPWSSVAMRHFDTAFNVGDSLSRRKPRRVSVDQPRRDESAVNAEAGRVGGHTIARH